jgi:hypothetical protein
MASADKRSDSDEVENAGSEASQGDKDEKVLPTDRSDVQMCREVDGGEKQRGVRRLRGGEEYFI